jgi:hypothetical protein
MSYLYNLPNSTSGADVLLRDTIILFPAFPALMLMLIFFVVFIGGITRQKIRTGVADYPAWATLASLSILIISLLLSVGQGYIGLDVLVIVVSLTILSGVWLFLDRRTSEV